jgi:hypothetical protein
MKMLLRLQQFGPKRLQPRNYRLDFEGEVIPHQQRLKLRRKRREVRKIM